MGKGRGIGNRLGSQQSQQRAQDFFSIRKIGGNPWQNFGHRARKGLTPQCTPTWTGGGGREAIGVPVEAATGQDIFQNLVNRGEPLAKFWSPVTRGWTHASSTPHPPTRLYFLLHHPLPRKASCQGGGSHRGKWGRRCGRSRPRALRPYVYLTPLSMPSQSLYKAWWRMGSERQCLLLPRPSRRGRL